MKLSPWNAWSDRNDIPVIGQRGVYLIATGVTRGEKPDISDKRIIYIGHTTGRLHDRLNNFDLSCRSYYGSHAGGQSFFKCKIAPKFENRREKVRQSDSGRGQVRKKMQEYIERNRGRFETRWEREKSELSVAVWAPSESDKGKLGKLSEEMRPTFAEVDLQAGFVLAHGHLPKFNKRIG